jgi:hypothetical protein
MKTADTEAKAELVSNICKGWWRAFRLSASTWTVIVAQLGSGMERWKVAPRNQFYLFRIRGPGPVVEVPVTFEAMHRGDPTGIGAWIRQARAQLQAQQKKRGPWVEWRHEMMLIPDDPEIG